MDGEEAGIDEPFSNGSMFLSESCCRYVVVTRVRMLDVAAEPTDFASEVQSSLSDEELQEVVSIIDKMGIGDFLRENPLTSLKFAAEVFVNSKSVGGFYDFITSDIEVATSKDVDDYGQNLEWGKTSKLSATASTPLLAVQRTLVHEIGHHIHNQIKKLYPHRFRYTMNPVLRQNAASAYGKRDNIECFAEGFAAYVFFRTEFIVYDGVGFKSMEAALKELGLKVNEL
jgi:hypothetical protein